jgi:hypothetical protein
MTISELIEQLKLLPQEAQVFHPDSDGGAPELVRSVSMKQVGYGAEEQAAWIDG